MNIKKGLLILLVFSLVGCEQAKSTAEKYRCNAEQLVLVEAEMKICMTSSYFTSACFDIAKSTLCTKIKEKDHDD